MEQFHFRFSDELAKRLRDEKKRRVHPTTLNLIVAQALDFFLRRQEAEVESRKKSK